VRRSASAGEGAVAKLDVDVCDEAGRVCVRLGGLQAQSPLEARSNAWPSTDRQGAAASGLNEPLELQTFEEAWQEQPLEARASEEIRTLVCLLSDAERRRTVAEVIEGLDARTRVIFVAQGAADQGDGPDYYRVRYGDPDSYRAVLSHIGGTCGEVDGLLCLWGLEDRGCVHDSAIIVDLLQAVSSTGLKCRRLLLVGDFETDLDRCHLESWVGFERALSLAWPQTAVAVIGQERMDDAAKATRECMLRLWAELQAEKAESALYVRGRRQVCRVQPESLAPGESMLRSGGTYLITGGCGGLGLLFARHLAKTRGANLILTGRSDLDGVRQERIKPLEALGSEVLYVQADVCDRAGMLEGLKAAEARFGAVHGVIHAAGIRGGESIFEKDVKRFREVLAPKVEGTLVLDEILRGKTLDFICHFSSAAAILGDFGSCDYAIGNRFLMAHARAWNRERERGERAGKAVVINWGLWQDGGIGFGGDARTHMYLKSSGQRALEADEGVAIFEQLLGQEATQHLVMAGQRSRLHGFLGLVEGVGRLEAPTLKGAAVGRGRREGMSGLSVAQCVALDLRQRAGDLLKIPHDRLDVEQNLADFGFDSISLAEFARRLTQHYGIELSPAMFFSYPTLEQFAAYLANAHGPVVEAFYQEEVPQPATSAGNVVPLTRRLPRRRSRPAAGVPEPIAIIGMSGRFPKARTVDDLWVILARGEDAVEEIPAERFDWRDYYSPQQEPGKTVCKWSGVVPGVDEFDPLFFEISPREAEMMDPRQRLLLMESWRALEDAGYGSAQFEDGKVGMFVGVEQGDYQLLTGRSGGIIGNHDGILAARLAYFLNLHGPTMAINTACSSALVALHQACSSLRTGECDTALAAGVNLLLTPQIYIGASQVGMLSKEGKCYAFNRRANGTVPGEAVAVVVLKRLSRAQAEGDPIRAVIRGSGINYDGKTNGITAPSGASQTSLFKEVYDRYRVTPEEIEYIVTHGTGTKLGDPVEVNALYDAFKSYTDRQGFCALTSNKTNFGHTFAASGLVSLIGLVQALRHETIPASLHCEELNDYINWEASPFYVNRSKKFWAKPEGRSRQGAVSAFGMSGTNAHVVVEGYSSEAETLLTLPPYFLLALSAKTEAALQEKIGDMVGVLEKKGWSSQDLLKMSYTLMCGRQHFNHRCAIVVRDGADAAYVWRQRGGPEQPPNLFQGKVPRNFVGQVAIQHYAEELLARSVASPSNIAKCREALHALADLYCQGYKPAWERLYGDVKPHRISLPTYPFAKERYWIGKRPATNADDERLNAYLDVCTVLDLGAAQVPLTTRATTGEERCPLSRVSNALASPSDRERLVAEIFADTLNASEIDIDSDFFEMGGHSILAMHLLRRVNDMFRVNLEPQTLVRARTVKLLAARIGELTEKPDLCDTERAVARLFSETIGVHSVDADADFFELGGHSILAMQLVGRVREVFGVELAPQVVISTRTPRQLAAKISETYASAFVAVDNSDETIGNEKLSEPSGM
jgi:3-oxoacyl-(acyl-carrier-protein) synthase/acyl carrier protein